MLDSVIEDWREHCLIQRGLQPRGFAQYERVVRSFFAWLRSRGLTATPFTVARDHVTEWQRSLFYESRNLSNRTRASKLSALRSFFAFLVYSGQIDHDPTEGIPSPKIRPILAQKFSTEELRMIFAAPDLETRQGVRDLAILKTMYATGSRVSELVALDTRHIHDTGGYIRVDIIGGKGGKSRTLTLRKAASRTLRNWMLIRRDIYADHDAVFVALQGEITRLSTRSVLNVVKKYAGLVGISSADAFCHKMRSTFATDLYDSGNDRCPRCGTPIQYVGLAELAVMMGHEDVKTTMGYIAISERTLLKTAIPDRRFNEIESQEDV
jgi:site-specific recombinase XerD